MICWKAFPLQFIFDNKENIHRIWGLSLHLSASHQVSRSRLETFLIVCHLWQPIGKATRIYKGCSVKIIIIQNDEPCQYSLKIPLYWHKTAAFTVNKLEKSLWHCSLAETALFIHLLKFIINLELIRVYEVEYWNVWPMLPTRWDARL